MAFSKHRSLLAGLLLLAGSAAAAQEWPGETTEIEPETAARVEASRLAERTGALLPSLVRLPPAGQAAASDLRALELFNATRPPRLQNGFSRGFEPHRIRLTADVLAAGAPDLFAGGLVARDDGDVTWSARFVVEEAYGFRIRLDTVELPRDAAIWVYTEGGETLGPFGVELVDEEGGIWLPPVEGSAAFVELRVPEGAVARGEVALTSRQVMEVFDVELDAFEPKVWTSCDIDGTCVSSGTLGVISDYRQAVARLSFVVGGLGYLCSGGLVNDQDTSGFRPFLLTANHCFSSQSSASSLVAYFDYETSSCNGSAPSLGSVPQVSGSTLLASNAVSDFTFVELSANPTGTRTYLGWTTTTPASNQTLYRLSHPSGTPQKFSTQKFLASGGITCTGLSRSNFHYSSGLTGSTTGGSSGSPVVDSGLHIVGQNYGKCHSSTWDECDYGTFNYIDGAFGTTYGYISSWLTATAPACTDDGYEPDDTCFGTIISSPQVHEHCDEDWVWFSGVAGATYVIETSSLIGGADTTLALHPSCGSQIAFDDDGGTGLASRIQFTASATDSYDVRVREFGDDYQDGEGYTVSVTCISGCGGTPLVFTDGFESGNLSAWTLSVP